ncbi:hypothetical protein TVAG_035510 [Trichomonas vaginalis G3]|uniref:Uncharacterized protein n=1 Tax=Trichomonas vaginalis (strain ATCC PRA-98 / G3) TaxID=412133 RepID=A2DAM5_TRIV3|nr:hypothetical protein TVAGG3_0811750 [Trichomonas vaginalis G3]EAY22528.1 hypothetical protein TVAG_035510 [Trichomonas vaginalis G3]KAI5497261.1 hypothetical protein TVAGG3_0811750 [Trichomonas vaginalis G3]|eukprot:XP_001583514.1 hypothetical protein [Trichomonas vaginalis G3]
MYCYLKNSGSHKLECNQLFCSLNFLSSFSNITVQDELSFDLEDFVSQQHHVMVFYKKLGVRPTFYSMNNTVIGFYCNEILFFRPNNTSAIFRVFFDDETSVKFEYKNEQNPDNSSLNHFVNYYQYQTLFFNEIIINGYSNSIAIFDECVWNTMGKQIIHINVVVSMKILLFTSIPAVIEVKGSTKIFPEAQGLSVDEIILRHTCEIKSEGKLQNFTIKSLNVNSQGKMEIDNVTICYIDYLNFQTSSMIFFRSSQDCAYSLREIHSNSHFYFDISDIKIDAGQTTTLDVFINESTDNSSEFRAESIIANGKFILKYKPIPINNDATVLTLSTKRLTNPNNFQIEPNYQNVIPENTLYLDKESKQEVGEAAEYTIWARKLNTTQYNVFSFDKPENCNEKLEKCLTPDKYSTWLDDRMDTQKPIYLNIRENVYNDSNFLNFYLLAKKQDIELHLSGKDKDGNCTRNNFYIDGLIFYEFKKIYADCVNVSVKNIRSKSNLETISINNSVIGHDLQNLVVGNESKIRNLSICNESLVEFMSDNKEFSFHDSMELTLLCDTDTITLHEDSILYNDKPIKAQEIHLDANYGNVTLIGDTDKKINYQLTIEDGVSLIIIKGKFSRDTKIRAKFSCNVTIVVETEFVPLYITVTQGAHITFVSTKTKLEYSELDLEQNSIIEYQLPDNSEINVKKLFVDDNNIHITSLNAAQMFYDVVNSTGPSINASSYYHFKDLVFAFKAGPEVIFNYSDDPKYNMTVNLDFSFFAMPEVRIYGSNYTPIHFIYVPHSDQYMEAATQLIKLNYNPYFKAMALICGPDISNETIDYKLSGFPYLYSKYYKLQKALVEGQTCLIGCLDKSYIKRNDNLYFGVFGSITGLIIIATTILLIRVFINYRQKKKSANMYQARRTLLSGAGNSMVSIE